MKVTKTASGTKKIAISKREWKQIGIKAGWMGKKADSDYYKPRFVKTQNPEVINFIEKIYMNIDDGRKFGEITSRRLADFLKGKGVPNQEIANEIQSLLDTWNVRVGETEFERGQLAGGWSAMHGDDI